MGGVREGVRLPLHALPCAPSPPKSQLPSKPPWRLEGCLTGLRLATPRWAAGAAAAGAAAAPSAMADWRAARALSPPHRAANGGCKGASGRGEGERRASCASLLSAIMQSLTWATIDRRNIAWLQGIGMVARQVVCGLDLLAGRFPIPRAARSATTRFSRRDRASWRPGPWCRRCRRRSAAAAQPSGSSGGSQQRRTQCRPLYSSAAQRYAPLKPAKLHPGRIHGI